MLWRFFCTAFSLKYAYSITSNIGFLTKGVSLKTLDFDLILTKSIIVSLIYVLQQ